MLLRTLRNTIVKAICVLHNFIRILKGTFTTPQILKEHYTLNHVASGKTIQPANAQVILKHIFFITKMLLNGKIVSMFNYY